MSANFRPTEPRISAHLSVRTDRRHGAAVDPCDARAAGVLSAGAPGTLASGATRCMGLHLLCGKDEAEAPHTGAGSRVRSGLVLPAEKVPSARRGFVA